MKENIKIVLLGIIAATLVYHTFFLEKEEVVPHSDDTELSELLKDLKDPSESDAPLLSETRTKSQIEFEETVHDFGEIAQNTKNAFTFKFTNTGDEPLIIENAKGSCGCTVPTYPKNPLKPGETGEIEVVYSPGKQQGIQTKTVTITANTDPITTVLSIVANVEEAEEAS